MKTKRIISALLALMLLVTMTTGAMAADVKLRNGDRGTEVRQLQQMLSQLGYAVSVDGAFGPKTETAVRQFQGDKGLKVDGIAGSATLSLLRSLTGGTTPSTPSTSGKGLFGGNYSVMRPGESSDRVRILQKALNDLGYNAGTVDGVYGKGTEAAVRWFQLVHVLNMDGKAGEKTLKAIESFFNADGSVIPGYTPPTGSAPSTTTPPTTTTAPSTGVPTRTLRPGDSGADVLSVQERLKELGYYTGTLDGKYGNGTTVAVSLFQQRNGLDVDGKAGSKTCAKLFSDSAIPAGDTVTNLPTNTPAPDSPATEAPATEAPATASPTPAPQYTVPSRTLRSGDTGADVVSVQSRLKDLGYYTGALDGVYGSGTVTAVMAFQQRNGLAVDGKAGAKTYAILYSNSAIPNNTTPATEAPSAAPTATPNTNMTLKKGSTGEAVTQLQKALLSLGYTVNTNGSYTNETVTAVKQFQSANGLNVDGIAGPNTLTKLYSGTAVGPSDTANGPGSTTAGVMANPPSNSQIQLLHWYNDIKPKLSGRPIVQIYDPASGLTWNIQIFSMGQHADGEPPTLQDTQIMYKAFGNQFTWNEKPVFVKLPSGVWCIASMHDRPHEGDMIPPSINGFEGTFNGTYENGHLCIHFPRDMAETEKNAPSNGVRHQNDIRKKWKEMTGQDIPW